MKSQLSLDTGDSDMMGAVSECKTGDTKNLTLSVTMTGPGQFDVNKVVVVDYNDDSGESETATDKTDEIADEGDTPVETVGKSYSKDKPSKSKKSNSKPSSPAALDLINYQ